MESWKELADSVLNQDQQEQSEVDVNIFEQSPKTKQTAIELEKELLNDKDYCIDIEPNVSGFRNIGESEDDIHQPTDQKSHTLGSSIGRLILFLKISCE